MANVSGMFKNKFENIKFDNQNASDVNLAWSIWKNTINEAALEVIGKSRKVKNYRSFCDKEIDKLVKERREVNRLKRIHDKIRNYDSESGQR